MLQLLYKVVKTPPIEFAIRILILLFCFVLVSLGLKCLGIPSPALIDASILFTLTVLFSQLVLRYCQIRTKAQPTYLGLSIGKFAVTDFLKGVVLILIIGFLALILELAIGWVSLKGYIWDVGNLGSVRFGLPFVILVVIQQISTGWREELFFRGYLIQIPSTKWGFVMSAIFSSIFFGALHYYLPPKIPWQLIPIDIVVGFLFAYCYHKRGLWFTIGLHFAWNTFPSSVFGLINPEISIIRLSYDFPRWATISGTLIDPWLLLFLFVLGVLSVRSRSNYIVSLDSIVI